MSGPSDNAEIVELALAVLDAECAQWKRVGERTEAHPVRDSQ